MYLDHEEARANKERREAYDELKKELLTKAAQDDKSSSASKRAYEFIETQEDEIEQLRERIKKYEEFFITLRDLTPRRHSIHDPIY